MKTIYKHHVAENDTVFYFHQIYGVLLTHEGDFITLVVASWVDDPSDRPNPTPDHTTNITLLMDSSLEDFIADATEKLMEIPGWNGMLFDNNNSELLESPSPPTDNQQIFPTAATGRIPVAYPT